VAERKGGKKNRKHGRNARRPATTRYNNERRWEKNKAKKIAKQAKKEAKQLSRNEQRLLDG